MCCNNNENNCTCFDDILCTIVKLQKQGQCIDSINNACDKPFLGLNPSSSVFNTRPVTFYTCPNNVLWTMPYTLNGTTGESSVFRCEAVEDCCCTCRVLAPNPDTTSLNPYVATDSFFTLNLNCVGALKCLDDTFVACI